MWFISPYRQLRLINHGAYSINIHYTAAYYYTIAINAFKRKGLFFFTAPHVAIPTSQLFTSEFRIVRIQYAGKAYRITKRRRMLHINMHYPTFKYVIWADIKLRHTKKKKKLFLLKYNTFTHIRSNLFKNLLRLRVPNTYTKRGILNNASIYYNRKQRTPSRR